VLAIVMVAEPEAGQLGVGPQPDVETCRAGRERNGQARFHQRDAALRGCRRPGVLADRHAVQQFPAVRAVDDLGVETAESWCQEAEAVPDAVGVRLVPLHGPADLVFCVIYQRKRGLHVAGQGLQRIGRHVTTFSAGGSC
jgi:hypothetical protein